MAKATKTAEEKPDYPGKEAVTSVMEQIGALSWEDRQNLMRRFSDLYNQEGDKRSMAKDFDGGLYY